jgi:hypothetical protein
VRFITSATANAAFMRDGRQMQGGIGGAAGRRHDSSGILERLAGDDIARAEVERKISDQAKVTRSVQTLLDGALGLPEKPWHDWDDWMKGLE